MKGKITKFGLILMLTFAAHALVLTQLVAFLTDVGYSTFERGLILAFYSLVAMLLQVLVGYLCDRYGVLKPFFVLILFAGVVAALIAYRYQNSIFIVHLVAFGIMGGMNRVADTLAELWVMETKDLYQHFGVIRSFGSLGWACAALASGFIVMRFGYAMLSVASLVFILLSMLVIVHREDAHLMKSTTLKAKDVRHIFKIKNYRILVLAFFVAYMVYISDTVVIVDLIRAHGGSATTIGLKTFVQAMVELPMFFLIGKLLLRFHGKKLTLFSFSILGLQFVLMALAPNNLTILIITLLQIGTFPIFLVTQRDLIYQIVPQHLRASSQMVGQSLTHTLASILAPLITGILLNFIPLQTLIAAMGAVMLIPIVIMGQYQT